MSKRELEQLLIEFIPKIHEHIDTYPLGEQLVVKRILEALKEYQNSNDFVLKAKGIINEYSGSKLINDIPFLELVIHIFNVLIRITISPLFQEVLYQILKEISGLITKNIPLSDILWKDLILNFYSEIIEKKIVVNSSFYKEFYSPNSHIDFIKKSYYERVFKNNLSQIKEFSEYYDQLWTIIPNNYFFQLELILLFVESSDIFRVFPQSGLIFSWQFYSFLQNPNSHLILAYIPKDQVPLILNYLKDLQLTNLVKKFDYTPIHSHYTQTNTENITYSVLTPQTNLSFLDIKDPIESILSMCELSFRNFSYVDLEKYMATSHSSLSLFNNPHRDLTINYLFNKDLLCFFTYSNFISNIYSSGQRFYLRITSSDDYISVLNKLRKIPLLSLYYNKETADYHVLGRMNRSIISKLEDTIAEKIPIAPKSVNQKLIYSEFDQLSLTWTLPRYLCRK